MNSIVKGTKIFFKFLYVLLKLCFNIIFYFFKGIKIVFLFLKDVSSKLKQHFKKLLRFSITFKITFFYGMIFSLLLMISSIAILIGFRSLLINQVVEKIQRDSNTIAVYIDTNPSFIEGLEYTFDSLEESFIVFDSNEEILYKTEGIEGTVTFYEPTTHPLLQSIISQDQIIINKKFVIDDDTYYIQTYKNITKENFYFQILSIILLVVNGITILLTLIFGSRASKKLLRPIDAMTNTVKTITIEDLNTRLDVSGSQDELKELAETFNSMFDRIQSSYEKQNQFVSDASHELRTPIAVIQGYINLLDRWGKNEEEVLQESIDAIKGESENMKDLIEKLLFLARTDKNLISIKGEEFYVNDLIDEVVKETTMIDSKHQIISINKEALLYFGDRNALKQALRVFIDNSIKFTPPGGEISVSSFKAKKNIAIEIKDTGIGISSDDIPHIFDRFYRADKSRTKETGGHGLGLSIAKWVIDSHRGSIKVESQINAGTKVIILLPHKLKSI